MSESVVEAHTSLTAKTLGAIEQVEFGEATDVPDISDAESVHQSFPRTYGKHRNANFFLKDDLYQIPRPPQFQGPGADNKAISYYMQDQEYIGKIKELQAYLDKVKKIVKSGCSQEVLNVALGSMSSLVNVLSRISSMSKPHASL